MVSPLKLSLVRWKYTVREVVNVLTMEDFILYATFLVVVVIWAEVKGLDRDD